MVPDKKRAAPVFSAKNTTGTANTPTTSKQKEQNVMFTINDTARTVSTPVCDHEEHRRTLSFRFEGDFDASEATCIGRMADAPNVQVHNLHVEGDPVFVLDGEKHDEHYEQVAMIRYNGGASVDVFANEWNNTCEREHAFNLAAAIGSQQPGYDTLKPGDLLVVCREVVCDRPAGFKPAWDHVAARGTDEYDRLFADPAGLGDLYYMGPQFLCTNGDDSWIGLEWHPVKGLTVQGEAFADGVKRTCFSEEYGAEDAISHIRKMAELYNGLLAEIDGTTAECSGHLSRAA